MMTNVAIVLILLEINQLVKYYMTFVKIKNKGFPVLMIKEFLCMEFKFTGMISLLFNKPIKFYEFFVTVMYITYTVVNVQRNHTCITQVHNNIIRKPANHDQFFIMRLVPLKLLV